MHIWTLSPRGRDRIVSSSQPGLDNKTPSQKLKNKAVQPVHWIKALFPGLRSKKPAKPVQRAKMAFPKCLQDLDWARVPVCSGLAIVWK